MNETFHRRRVRRVAVLVILACLAIGSASAVAPSTAPAAEATPGDAISVPLGVKRGSGLRAAGLRISALKPARLRGGALVLPVTDVSLPEAGKGQLVLAGGLRLRSGGRATTIRGLLLTVSGGRVTVTAKLGTSRRVLLLGAAAPDGGVDATRLAVSVTGARARLSRAAATGLSDRLARKIGATALGTVRGGATVYLPPVAPAGSAPGNDPLPADQDSLSRPASAVDVTGASLRWWLRDSWVEYIANGGYEPIALGSATANVVAGSVHHCADVGANSPSAPHVYAVDLPFSNGWYDAASGKAVLKHGGGARFYFPGHGIDISAQSAELEFNGAQSRALFSFSEAGAYSDRRAVLGALVVDSPPGPGVAGTYRVALPDSTGEGVFAGFYTAGSAFGCFEASFTVAG